MTIRDELLGLIDDQDGMIHAARVVTWAANNPDSELHAQIEWDDAKAAYEHRLNQARRLIAIHVVFEDTGRRSTVSLIVDRSRGGGYRDLPSALTNVSMRLMLIRQTLDEVERVLARYPQLSELAPLVQAVEVQRRNLEARQLPLAAD